MAEVDTLMLSQEHSDLRREAVEHTNEIVREGLKESFNTRGDVKDSRFDVASRINEATNSLSQQIDAIDDTLTAQIINLARDTTDVRAQVTAVGYQVRDGFVAAGKDAEIQALRTQMEAAKNTTYLADKISADGSETRRLISELKNADLNRMLIERNTEVVEERGNHYHWRHHADLVASQGQWASVQNQLQAFASQLQETRQGINNFGTMAGVGMSSTNNNVR